MNLTLGFLCHAFFSYQGSVIVCISLDDTSTNLYEPCSVLLFQMNKGRAVMEKFGIYGTELL